MGIRDRTIRGIWESQEKGEGIWEFPDPPPLIGHHWLSLPRIEEGIELIANLEEGLQLRTQNFNSVSVKKEKKERKKERKKEIVRTKIHPHVLGS